MHAPARPRKKRGAVKSRETLASNVLALYYRFMKTARIYKPAKNAMQSGQGNTKDWILEFDPSYKFVEPLMGWVGTKDTTGQVRLSFPTQDAAIEYATKHHIPFKHWEPKKPVFKPKSYAANFAFNRVKD